MDAKIQKYMENILSTDRGLQNQAYLNLLKETEQPVDWAYDVWDSLVEGLTSRDNHVRSISAQVLASLAKSDPENRMKKDFPALMAVSKDERYVTARHSLQSVWKVGLEKKMRKSVVAALTDWFQQCQPRKGYTLIRYDIIRDLRNLYDATGEETIKRQALRLIESEDDDKYRRKYAGVWK